MPGFGAEPGCFQRSPHRLCRPVTRNSTPCLGECGSPDVREIEKNEVYSNKSHEIGRRRFWKKIQKKEQGETKYYFVHRNRGAFGLGGMAKYQALLETQHRVHSFSWFSKKYHEGRTRAQLREQVQGDIEPDYQGGSTSGQKHPHVETRRLSNTRKHPSLVCCCCRIDRDLSLGVRSTDRT